MRLIKTYPSFPLILILLSNILLTNIAGGVLPDTLNIESRRELFVDYYLIDRLEQANLVLHEPIDQGPVLQFNKSWEGPFCGYCTIIDNGEFYQLYYRGLPETTPDDSAFEATCYAQSNDGINWEKPNLRLFEVKGTWDNNVILTNAASVTHNFSPFLDTRTDVKPERRYKALGGTGRSGLLAYVSVDGIRWRKLKDEAVFTQGKFDSQNVAFWSESEQCYVCYFRTWTGTGYGGFRTVSRTTSRDFVHWSDPVEMDFGDTPREHIYTNQTHPYFRAPHIYIALAARFMPNRQVLSNEDAQQLHVNPNYFKDCSDAVLMTSRGGNFYQRTFMEAFIRPGIGLQNWVSRSNYPALNIVQTGSPEMSIYVNQDYAQPSAHLRRYAMRLDGFVSVHASYKGGELITKPFYYKGGRLYINFATSAAGEIRIEVQDVSGDPLPGFALDDSVILIGNEIERVVSWNNSVDVSLFAGKAVRLRFRMKDAHLYALQFK